MLAADAVNATYAMHMLDNANLTEGTTMARITNARTDAQGSHGSRHSLPQSAPASGTADRDETPLSWAPLVPIQYVAVDGTYIRYMVAGNGPALVLLHTLRTQLDMFQKVIGELATRFRVYALDYPGHGHSDAPDADYSAEYFVTFVAQFLERLNIQNAVLAGESIGGAIALLLAARHNPRVRGVVAINPYDYDRGRGFRRSPALANTFIGMSGAPLIGRVVRRVQPYPAVKRILFGGVFR